MAFTGTWGQWYEEAEHPRGQGGRWTSKGDGATPSDERAPQRSITEGPKLSQAEVDALANYVDQSSSINKLLRTGARLGADEQRVVDTLDNLIAKHRLTEDVTVYRGLRGSDQLEGLKAGARLYQASFTSTTKDLELARREFGGAGFPTMIGKQPVTVMAIQLPRGTKALDVVGVLGPQTYGLPDMAAEQEVLLPRDTRLEFQGLDRTGVGLFKLAEERPSDEPELRARATEELEIFAPGYIKRLRAAADKVADAMEFERSRISFELGVPRTEFGVTQASYDGTDGGKIEVFPMVGEPNEHQVGALLSHEITHHKFFTVVKAWRAEAVRMSLAERKKHDAGKIDAAFRKKFPVASMMRPFGMGECRAHATEAMRVSAYAKEFWEREQRGKGASVDQAVNETLAEVARHRFEGTLPASKFWEDAVDTVAKAYKIAQKPGRKTGGERPSDEERPEAERLSSQEFDAEKWRAMGMQKARTEWAKLTREQRDAYADARDSVRKRLHDIVGFKQPPRTGNAHKDIRDRITYLSSVLPAASVKRVDDFATQAHDILGEASDDEQGVADLTMSMLDHVAAQEFEAMGRTLGDHGEHHIEQDEKVALKLLSLLPSNVDTPRNRALMVVAAAYHDTGYLTEPARVFLNVDHPRWSTQYYQENVAPQVSKLFGEDFSEMAASLISTHSDSTIDWDSKPEQSCFSVADNLALFQEEKMPPLLRDVKGNTKVLVDLGRGKIKLDAAQRAMRANIKASDLSATLKAQALRAVKEVSGVLPKYTLGMLGTKLGEISWKDDHPLVEVQRHEANEALCKVLDFGQKQFEKLAETYNHSGEEFLKTGQMVLKDTAGKTLLEVRLVKGGVRRRVREPWL